MKKIFLLFLISAFIFSCDNGSTPIDTTKVTISGSLSKKDVEKFDPPYLKGTKFSYVATKIDKDNNQTKEESTTEVLEYNQEKKMVKIKFTAGNNSFTKEDYLENFAEGLPEKGIEKLNNEDIKVLAGEFKNTTVVSFNYEYNKGIFAKSKLWLYEGIGAIKKEDILPDNSKIIAELKGYKVTSKKEKIDDYIKKIKKGSKYNNIGVNSDTKISYEFLDIKDNTINLKEITIPKDTTKTTEITKNITIEDYFNLKTASNYFIEPNQTLKINNKDYTNLTVFYYDYQVTTKDTQGKEVTSTLNNKLYFSEDKGLIKMEGNLNIELLE
ncbi:MAG: hypothetical protein U0457_04555 [Candidatus Sericytochromatia bacterium]